jgi:hypothetical protein
MCEYRFQCSVPTVTDGGALGRGFGGFVLLKRELRTDFLEPRPVGYGESACPATMSRGPGIRAATASRCRNSIFSAATMVASLQALKWGREIGHYGFVFLLFRRVSLFRQVLRSLVWTDVNLYAHPVRSTLRASIGGRPCAAPWAL